MKFLNDIVLTGAGADLTAPATVTFSGLALESSHHAAVMISSAGVLSKRALGSNAFTSTTIPTNNNQLTNGNGYLTASSTQTKYLRSDTSDTASGFITLSGGVTGNNSLMTSFFLPQNPEGSHVKAPWFFNDMAYSRLRGSTITVTVNGGSSPSNSEIDAMFDASTGFWNMPTSGVSSVVIEITNPPKTMYHGAHYGITFGNSHWRAKNVDIDTFYSSAYQEVVSITGNTKEFVYGAKNSGSNAVSKIKWTFSDFNTTSMRIVSLFAYNYNATGMPSLYLTKDGGEMFGAIDMNSNKITELGTPTGNADAATKAYVDGAVIANTDTQDLSISGQVISLTNGGSVTIPTQTSISGNAATATSAAKLTDGGTITTHPGTNNLIHTGQISNGTSGLFTASDNSNSIITVNRHGGNYNSQLGFSSNGNIYYRKFSNSTNNAQAWEQVYHSGNIIPSADLDADTAHLSTTQTFTGAKTFTGTVALTGTGRITGVDTVSASTDAASKAYVDGAVIANTDTQDLSISGRVISLTNGGSVTVPETTIPTIPSGNQIIDWTSDQGSTNIHAGNYTDTNTTYTTATSSALGLVKIGYSENGKNYPVELSSGKMYVNVPWANTQNANEADAAEGTKGVVALATEEEVAEGTDTSKATTSRGVKTAIDSLAIPIAGNKTITGTKTFSSTISGSINGNSATTSERTITSGEISAISTNTNKVGITTGSQTISGSKTFSSPIKGQVIGIASNSSYINKTAAQFAADGTDKVYIGSNNYGWNDARDYATNFVDVDAPILNQNDAHNGIICPVNLSQVSIMSQVRMNAANGAMQVRVYKMARPSGVNTSNLALTQIATASVSTVNGRMTTLDATGTTAVSAGDLIIVGFGKTSGGNGQKPRINFTLTGTTV